VREYQAVCEVCERLIELDPTSGVAVFLLAKCRQILCLWDDFGARRARFAAVAEQGHVERGMAMTSMLISDDAALHRRCAELTARCYTGGRKLPAPPRLAARRTGRPRIAYVSADFRQHPVGSMVAALIEAHDRDRFEIIGVSLGQDDGSPQRQRLSQAFERFVDMHETPTDAILRALREIEIDIAVDLMGYTHDCRPALFMQRVAPVQVSYLGFPGTTGIAAMDYLIADPFIAAGDLKRTATEKLVLLPDCFFPGDRLEATPLEPPSRSSCGLPEDAFVLCSFNDRRKLTPEAFDSWMRILRQVETGVLWLSRPPEAAAAALRREAESRGVDAGRIIFAERVPSHAQHIARNAVPDLHLDTFPYNAHATATDALRAGAPILTRAGASFASRVCGSLLTAIGVPELVTHSAEAYEALAVRLAHDKATLADLRDRIAHGRAHSPVFDMVRLTRNIERAYAAMLELSRAGKPPAEIDVRASSAAH
jgi:protein O-GlcNAc transferase